MPLPNPHRLSLRLLFMAGAAGLFFLGYLWGNQYRHRQPPEPLAIGGVLVRPPAAVPEFRLADPAGRIFDRRTLAAGWTLLAFGDLAQASGQLAVARLIDVYNRVSDREALHRDLRLVLVAEPMAPDPARRLCALSPALYILGGDAEQVRRLGDSLGVDQGASGTLFVFAPGGALVALLGDDRNRADLASDLVALHTHADAFSREEP